MHRTAHISSKNYYILTKTVSENEKVPFESNPVPYPVYLYLSMSLFLVSLTAPNKQFSKAESKLLRVDHKQCVC